MKSNIYSNIQRKDAGSVVNSTIREIWSCGSKEELKIAVESYLRSYDSRGYGTSFQPILKNETDQYWTMMFRFSSCD